MRKSSVSAIKKYIKQVIEESTAGDFSPEVKVSEFHSIFQEYYKSGQYNFTLPRIDEEQVRWLLFQLFELIDEFRENSIDTGDYLNTLNWGRKLNGDLAMFDIGFSVGNIHFHDEPSHVELDEEEYETRTGIDNTIISNLASKLGLAIVGNLGNGALGDAYDVGNGTVLKVTMDKSEAVNSKLIIGKKLKHIAEVYEVRQFKSQNKWGIKNVYYTILLEKLTLDDHLDVLFNKLETYFKKNRNFHLLDTVISAVAKCSPISGEFLMDMYKNGSQTSWDKWTQKYKSGEVPDNIDLDDLETISEWIQGSKTNLNDIEEAPPEGVAEMLNHYLSLK